MSLYTTVSKRLVKDVTGRDIELEMTVEMA